MVKLVKMTEQDFDCYLEETIKRYAEEKIKAGAWIEAEALGKSEGVFKRLLPNGVDSEGQYVFSAFDENTHERVGYIWFQDQETLAGREAFIYDFLIYEEFRCKGYGAQTLAALDEKAKKLGIRKISLHVFGHNNIAYELYKKMGYITTDINMTKCLL